MYLRKKLRAFSIIINIEKKIERAETRPTDQSLP